MSDTLASRVTGLEDTDVMPIHVNLVMSDATLLSLDDSPAHLAGCGPLSAVLPAGSLPAGPPSCADC